MDKLLTVADIHMNHHSVDYQYEINLHQQQQVSSSQSNAKTSAFRLVGTNGKKVISCSSSSTTSSSTNSSTNCNENEFILPACLNNETSQPVFFNQQQHQHPTQAVIDNHRPVVGTVCLSSSSSVQSASYSSGSSSSSSSSSTDSINLNQNAIKNKANRLSNGCVPQEYE